MEENVITLEFPKRPCSIDNASVWQEIRSLASGMLSRDEAAHAVVVKATDRLSGYWMWCRDMFRIAEKSLNKAWELVRGDTLVGWILPYNIDTDGERLWCLWLENRKGALMVDKSIDMRDLVRFGNRLRREENTYNIMLGRSEEALKGMMEKHSSPPKSCN